MHTTSIAAENKAQLVCAADRLEGSAGLIPQTRRDPRSATSGRDAADCVLERVLDRNAASIVLRLVEFEIGSDAVVLPRARLHGLYKGFATQAATVGTRIERGCEGIFATGVC